MDKVDPCSYLETNQEKENGYVYIFLFSNKAVDQD